MMGLTVEHRSARTWHPVLRGGARLLTLVMACSGAGWSAAQSVSKNPALAPPHDAALSRLQADLLEPALRFPVSRRAQLVVQTRPWQPGDALTSATLPPMAQQSSLGLEFKATRPTDGALSLLRVQLSGDSVLQFRPRGGGLAVTYRSQF